MRNRTKPVVAIDGPAGAGKSTVTRRVAEELGYFVLDTGALYRSVALAARRAQLSSEDGSRLGALALELAEKSRLVLGRGAGTSQVWLDGEDVSLAIRTQEIGDGASRISSLPEVRAGLLALQRRVGEQGGVVVEGRDIGSVVFPDAEVKFFLTASTQVRAERRTEELRARGETADFEAVHREVVERDRRDMSRPIAPLVQAPDALVIDSSHLGIEEVVGQMVAIVRALEVRHGAS